MPSSVTPPPAAPVAHPARRVGGLTGLRALAVVAVLGYHLAPASLPGGFVGVDVFFVVSGFIVTRLLLVERSRTGTVRLGAFWMRRARRIVPALVSMLAVCVPLAAAVDPALLHGIRRQLVGAATFSSNWLAVAADGDYFRAARPELLTNLWSLAVEEQFYLLCPLLLVLAVGVLRLRRRTVVLVASSLAVLSAVAMGLLASAPLGSPTRAYVGTDTHAFGLLLGVALAVALGVERLPARQGRLANVPLAIGGVSAATLAVLAVTMTASDGLPAHGGLALASAAAAGLVWAGATVPALGRLLDSRPLRWLGERSYAVYLWHWPLLLILGATPLGGLPVLLAVVVAVVSLCAAAASHVLIEEPLRRGSLRHGDPVERRRRQVPVMAMGVLVVVTLGVAAMHDDTSEAERLVARGRSAVESSPSAPPSAPPAPSATPAPTATAATPPLAAVQGGDVTAIGDSVMLAAAPQLQAALPGIAIDAEVSRSMWAAPEMLSALAHSGALRPVVVVGLATNGEVGEEQLTQVLDIVGDRRTLVLVTGHADRGWIPGANAALADFAAGKPNVVVADWDTAIAAHADELADDGIHPEPSGGDVYAATVRGAIETALARDAGARAGHAPGAGDQGSPVP